MADDATDELPLLTAVHLTGRARRAAAGQRPGCHAGKRSLTAKRGRAARATGRWGLR